MSRTSTGAATTATVPVTPSGSRRRGPAPPPAAIEQAALFDAARALMRSPRPDGATFTLAELLERADLGTRSFYRHYESKDAFLLALWVRETDHAVATLRARVAAADGGRAAIDAWIDDRLDRLFDPRPDATFETLWRDGFWARAALPMAYRRRVLRPIVEVLRDAIAAAGAVTGDTVDPELDAFTIHATFRMLAERYYDGPPVTRAEARTQLDRVVVGLLGPV